MVGRELKQGREMRRDGRFWRTTMCRAGGRGIRGLRGKLRERLPPPLHQSEGSLGERGADEEKGWVWPC